MTYLVQVSHDSDGGDITTLYGPYLTIEEARYVADRINASYADETYNPACVLDVNPAHMVIAETGE